MQTDGQAETGKLAPGGEIALQVSVQIPKEAMAKDESRVSLKATSISNSTVTGHGTITVEASQTVGVEITPPSSVSGLPGSNVSVVFLVKNTGNWTLET